MKVKSESEVAQSCPTLFNPVDCSPPGSSAHGIFLARVLECKECWTKAPVMRFCRVDAATSRLCDIREAYFLLWFSSPLVSNEGNWFLWSTSRMPCWFFLKSRGRISFVSPLDGDVSPTAAGRGLRQSGGYLFSGSTWPSTAMARARARAGRGRGSLFRDQREMVRSGSAGWIRENRKRSWAYTSKRQRGLKNDAQAQVAQARQAPKGSSCARKPTAPPVLLHGPGFHQDKSSREDYGAGSELELLLQLNFLECQPHKTKAQKL